MVESNFLVDDYSFSMGLLKKALTLCWMPKEVYQDLHGAVPVKADKGVGGGEVDRGVSL